MWRLAMWTSLNTVYIYMHVVCSVCECRIWNALTDNYGSVLRVDWSQSKARSLHLSTLSIEDRPVSLQSVFCQWQHSDRSNSSSVSVLQRMESVNLDLSDDEDLREQMDLHSIIVSCVSEEPLLTAEQVTEPHSSQTVKITRKQSTPLAKLILTTHIWT